MVLLALDTSLDSSSVALYDPKTDHVLAAARALLSRGHAEILFGQIEDVSARAGIPLKTVERFAVTIGPGSFTGVRVGLAAARGLALAAGRPLIGLTTFEALIAPLAPAPDAAFAVALDARRGEVYAAAFRGRSMIGAPLAAAPEAAARAIAGRLRTDDIALIGSGASLVLPFLEGAVLAVADTLPDAASFVRHAARLAPPPAPPEPLYLRAPDAKLPAARPSL